MHNKANRFDEQDEEQSLLYKLVVNVIAIVGIVYFIKYFLIP